MIKQIHSIVNGAWDTSLFYRRALEINNKIAFAEIALNAANGDQDCCKILENARSHGVYLKKIPNVLAGLDAHINLIRSGIEGDWEQGNLVPDTYRYSVCKMYGIENE